ncbi:hypothetical protein BD324DRAFT_613381 [Kockovaella imperatae]|uniref:DUF726-domain-containing protein n=1 Tax=Kockovaella imperatae TaxID=4999 RepID=A0A1Y1UT03_9TREE|nr:hypothetical protein BD324DRAFT_613381 [Kockovaella imperatae]ORX41140.1 hypothetical protein BD324DRAFT_613381 [Kockovaella imperatae]
MAEKSSNSEPQAGPLPLPQPLKLLLALGALSTSQTVSNGAISQWQKNISAAWVQSICQLIEFDAVLLPPTVVSEGIKESAADQIAEWTEEQKHRIAEVLVEASLASSRAGSQGNTKAQDEQLRYTPLARAWSFNTMKLLGLPARDLLPKAEKELSAKLFMAMKAAEEADSQKEVESTRAAHSEGWGGKLGRTLATGAGVVAGGILVGVTGGLAAPAIAALLAPLGIGGLLAGGAAPVVLGTLFGVGGGGLAGKRVRERWKGVEEFSFIEVGAGTRATKEEVQDLKEAKKRLAERKAEEEKAEKASEKVDEGSDPAEQATIGDTALDEKTSAAGNEAGQDKPTANDELPGAETPAEIAPAEIVGESKEEIEQRLVDLSLERAADDSRRSSMDAGRPTLEQAHDETSSSDAKKKALPSLTATIVVPGLLVISKTEAISAWRSICASGPLSEVYREDMHDNDNGPAINYTPRRKSRQASGTEATAAAALTPRAPETDERAVESTVEEQAVKEEVQVSKTGLRDGRDVYLLRFESDKMLKTGSDIENFIGRKILTKLKGEIIKRTALNAYFAAVKLPLMTYKMAMMGMDNTWMQAQDRAKKAGRLLGEVLEKKVQGERPVVLIGTSLGAYTVLEALLYLASRPPPAGSRTPAPTLVESAILISLPSAPTEDEWARARSVVARRFVNAYSDKDLVLATVVRVHEMISRAATLSNGIMPAGLGPVERPGIEDVDVSSILRGHLEIQAKIGDVINLIGIDA